MPRTVRLYSLFHKIGGKYVRQVGLALPKPSAIRIFQSRLLADCFAGKSPELRPVAASYTAEQLAAVAAGAALSVADCCKLLDKQPAPPAA